MPEPIVVGIPDGETVKIEMHWRHYKTRLDFHADIREGDEEDVAALHGVHVQGCLRGCFGPLSMRPDPVRAAVLEERERIRAGIRTACEHHDADPALVEGLVRALDAPVAALAKRSEELAACREKVREFGVYEWKDAQLKKALATCREELEVTREELAKVLGEGDALKVQWCRLRERMASVYAGITLACQAGDSSRRRDILEGCQTTIQLALEPTTNSDGAVKEDKCPRADMEAKSCARDS